MKKVFILLLILLFGTITQAQISTYTTTTSMQSSDYLLLQRGSAYYKITWTSLSGSITVTNVTTSNNTWTGTNSFTGGLSWSGTASGNISGSAGSVPYARLTNASANVSVVDYYGTNAGIVFNASDANVLKIPYYSTLTGNWLLGQVGVVPSGQMIWSYQAGSGVSKLDSAVSIRWLRLNGFIAGSGTLGENTVGSIQIIDSSITGADIAEQTIKPNQLSGYGTAVGSVLRNDGYYYQPIPIWGAIQLASTGQVTLNDSITHIHKPFMATTVVRLMNDSLTTDSLGNKVRVGCDYGVDQNIYVNIPFTAFNYDTYLTIDSIQVYGYANKDGCDLHAYLDANTNTGSYNQVDSWASVYSSITGTFHFTATFGYQYTSDLPLTLRLATTAYEATYIYFYNFIVYASY